MVLTPPHCLLLAPSALPLPQFSLPWIFFHLFSPLAWKNWILLPKALFPAVPWRWLEPGALAVALGVTAMPTGPKNSVDLGPGQSLDASQSLGSLLQGHRDRGQVMPWMLSPSRLHKSPQWLAKLGFGEFCGFPAP